MFKDRRVPGSNTYILCSRLSSLLMPEHESYSNYNLCCRFCVFTLRVPWPLITPSTVAQSHTIPTMTFEQYPLICCQCHAFMRCQLFNLWLSLWSRKNCAMCPVQFSPVPSRPVLLHTLRDLISHLPLHCVLIIRDGSYTGWGPA